ncbi:MAG: alpha/beta fold hydrolase [Betaproteobacteria bacterium]|nr:alpha/beta fold hydrolase [Betaproteobacteria bacterium]
MSALPPALGGERFEFDSPAGRLSCYAAGQGAPLLLVHSVNAAASAAEVRPLYEHWQAARTVFAVDLPGYGLSDRSDRAYTPRLMTDALHATLEQIQQRCGKAPVDALAVSLGCEFLARAAVEAPARVRRLALVSPTGFNGTRRRRGPPGSVVGAPWIERMVRGPGWGGPLFRALTRPSVIRYFLRRTWGGPAIDEAMARYAELTTRVPGAEHAPLAFLSAQLFSQDINTVYEQFAQPVWMSHGVRGDFTDYRGKDSVEGRPNWRFTVFATGAMPYFELPGDFNAALGDFLAAAPSPARGRGLG